MATGIVRFYNDAKGFGLITPDAGGPPIFAQSGSIKAPGVKKLKPTQRVEYDIESRPEGMVSSNIRLLA